MALGWAIRKMELTWSRVIRNRNSSLWGPCEECGGHTNTRWSEAGQVMLCVDVMHLQPC